jgi:hypothetical protein
MLTLLVSFRLFQKVLSAKSSEPNERGYFEESRSSRADSGMKLF